VISLPKIPYIHRIHMVLANPIYVILANPTYLWLYVMCNEDQHDHCCNCFVSLQRKYDYFHGSTSVACAVLHSHASCTVAKLSTEAGILARGLLLYKSFKETLFPFAHMHFSTQSCIFPAFPLHFLSTQTSCSSARSIAHPSTELNTHTHKLIHPPVQHGQNIL